MATTRMTATNTLNKGLVMDFNPTVTKADLLTNALNATLLTYNGNEMQLQQDMGNGRVETAYLPEGYVPVGTCEFGDIIYIVSYNPLQDKCQIGCFPSPERNITSDEISDMQQNLTASDFQVLSGSTPTGAIKSTSVKKIVYGNKNMNPGDKYIIYEEGTALESDAKTLSDYANTSHEHNTWPKLLKLNIVSIEDSGKIVDLNASVKWYDNDYYLTHMNTEATGNKPDLDSYRSLVSSAYSVFQSKVSGKLAILAELETITGFSCTYDAYTVNTENSDGSMSTKYLIYFYTAWDTDHNDVNPSGFIVTKSAWTTIENGGKLVIPVSDGTTVTYQVSSANIDVPVASAANSDASAYDASKVYEYTRTYELENPSSSFSQYITTDSYNAKIDDVLDWMKSGTSYAAVNLTGSSYDNLRTVTKVTRLLDTDLGIPLVTSSGAYEYVYNLDSYEYDSDSNSYNYMTKGIDGSLLSLNAIAINDDVINNYFHKDIPSCVTDSFTLSRTTAVTVNGESVVLDNDLTKLVWNYTVAPVMPYGVLDYLSVSGNIDFSKLGTGLIDLTAWKYYTSGNVSTLTWGLDAYTEPNKGIAEVVFDFYDNQGLAASYHVTNKTSFAGTFTEQIVLNQQNSSYKLNNVDAYGNTYIHAGEEDSSGTIYLTDGNKPTTDETSHGPYLDDSGTLYPNLLYLVRITVKYCTKDIVGDYNTDNTSEYKTYYRWYWTNGMFNDMYYNTLDFNELYPRLSIDFSATFDTKGSGGTNKLSPVQYLYRNTDELEYDDNSPYCSTLGANVYAINQDSADDNVGNILLTLAPGLSEGFNTFNLNAAALDLISDVTVKLGNSTITKTVDSPSTVHTGDSFTTTFDDSIQPVVASKLCSHDSSGWDRSGYASYSYGANGCVVSDTLLAMLEGADAATRNTYSAGISDDSVANTTGDATTEIYSTDTAYASYLDSFSLNIVGASLSTEEYTYYDSEGNQQTVGHCQSLTTSLKTVMEDGIKLCLTGTAYSKIFASEITQGSGTKVLKSIIHDASADAQYYSPGSVGLHYYNEHLYFNDVITWHMGASRNNATRYGSFHSKGITTDNWTTGADIDGTALSDQGSKWHAEYDEDAVQSLWKNQLSSPVAAFMICRSNSSNGHINSTDGDVSWNKIRTSFGLQGNSGNKIHDSDDCCPLQIPTEWDSDDWSIHSFMVYDSENNLVVPFADYFISMASPMSQRKRGGSPVAETLADMLGSVFAQLYVVDTSAETNFALMDNFVYLQDYTEYWNKDIIIEANTDDISYEDARNLLTIQTQVMTDYYNYLATNSGIDIFNNDDILTNNIDMVIYGIKRALAFQYAVDYNLGNLLYLYTRNSESTNRIHLSTISSATGTPTVESFTGNVTANTFYTWTGENVMEFGSGSTLYYAINFEVQNNELYMVPSSTYIDSTSFASLAKVLKYNNGTIYWANLSQFLTWGSTYTIHYYCPGENPWLCDLPKITIFNLYTPGS